LNEATAYPYFVTSFSLAGLNGKKEKRHPHENTTIPSEAFLLSHCGMAPD